jgi:hypothetical protein
VTDFIQSNTGAVILKIAYRWTVISNDDPLVLFIEEGLRLGSEITQPGRWLVEILVGKGRRSDIATENTTKPSGLMMGI